MHALTEARRVLAGDGLLIDLRPSAVHRKVHAVLRKDTRLLGVMRERFDDERAADRAVGAAAGTFDPACSSVVRVASSTRRALAGHLPTLWGPLQIDTM